MRANSFRFAPTTRSMTPQNISASVTERSHGQAHLRVHGRDRGVKQPGFSGRPLGQSMPRMRIPESLRGAGRGRTCARAYGPRRSSWTYNFVMYALRAGYRCLQDRMRSRPRLEPDRGDGMALTDLPSKSREVLGIPESRYVCNAIMKISGYGIRAHPLRRESTGPDCFAELRNRRALRRRAARAPLVLGASLRHPTLQRALELSSLRDEPHAKAHSKEQPLRMRPLQGLAAETLGRLPQAAGSLGERCKSVVAQISRWRPRRSRSFAQDCTPHRYRSEGANRHESEIRAAQAASRTRARAEGDRSASSSLARSCR